MSLHDFRKGYILRVAIQAKLTYSSLQGRELESDLQHLSIGDNLSTDIPQIPRIPIGYLHTLANSSISGNSVRLSERNHSPT